mgnify:CR=1 FL=1
MKLKEFLEGSGKKVFTCFLVLTLVLFSLANMPFLVEAQAPKISITQVYWGSLTEKVQAKPGDRNLQLNVVVRNVDTVTMSNVKAKLVLEGSPFTTPTGEKEAYAGVLSLQPSQEATLTFTLNIDKNAKLGVYKLEMEVTSVTVRYATGVSSTTTIYVPVYGEVSFLTFLSPKEVFPGSNTLTLTVKNVGEAKASNLEVYVGFPSPLVVMGRESKWSLGEINPSQSLTIPMEVYIPLISAGKAYPITVTVSYVDAYGFSHTEKKTLGLAVEKPLEKPLIKVGVSNNGEIVSGEKNLLNITLTNSGKNEILNLDVVLGLPRSAAASTPLILLGEDNFWHFERVKPNQTVLIPVVLTTSKGVVGTYQATLTLTYQDKRNQTYQETRSIGLVVLLKTPSSLVNIESYKVNPEKVYQGESFTLNFNLKNFGDFKAQMVTVTLTPPTLFATLSPSTVSLGNLNPGESRTVSFKVMASTSVKAGVVYMFRIDIAYTDSRGVRQVTTNTLGVPIHGKIEFTVYDFTVTPSPTHIGEKFTVSFTILNMGTSTAKYVNASIVESKTFKLTVESSSYIGDVDPNAPAPVSLTAKVSQDAEEGEYPLKILLSYKDEYDKPHSFTYETTVKVSLLPKLPKTGKTSPSTLTFMFPSQWVTVITAIIVIVAVVFLAKKVKGKSKEKQ